MNATSVRTSQGPDEYPVRGDDALFLALEKGQSRQPPESGKPWKVLVVDDEKEIHVVTRLALEDFSFAGRSSCWTWSWRPMMPGLKWRVMSARNSATTSCA
jgi:hypothetical protein